MRFSEQKKNEYEEREDCERYLIYFGLVPIYLADICLVKPGWPLLVPERQNLDMKLRLVRL